MDSNVRSGFATPIEINVHTTKLSVAEFKAVKLKKAASIPISGFCEAKLKLSKAPVL